MASSENQLCAITVFFPSADDAFSIGIKKQIEEMLSSIPESRIDFRIGSRPGATQPSLGPQPHV